MKKPPEVSRRFVEGYINDEDYLPRRRNATTRPINPVPTSATVEGSGTSCPPTIELVGENTPPPAASKSWTSAICMLFALTESFTDGNTTTYVGNEVRLAKFAVAENAAF